MYARGIDGGGGDDVGIVVTGFGGVLGGQYGVDLAQPHPGNRIEQTGIDFETFRIDDLGIGRRRYAGAYRGYFPVANHHRTVFDHWSGQRVNLCVGDSEYLAARCHGSLGSRLRAEVRRCEKRRGHHQPQADGRHD